jgi:hypothetical protein
MFKEELKELEQEDTPKPKQYLLMADELHMAVLSKLLPGLMYVQVQGMAIAGNSDHMILVSPLPHIDPKSIPSQLSEEEIFIMDESSYQP